MELIVSFRRTVDYTDVSKIYTISLYMDETSSIIGGNRFSHLFSDEKSFHLTYETNEVLSEPVLRKMESNLRTLTYDTTLKIK